MKKLVTISLFIFWAIITAVLTAGLLFYQGKASNRPLGSTGVNTPNNGQGTDIVLDMVELVKHNTIKDCWLLISGKIYNVSNYLSTHPGGVGAISPYCGKDGSQAFATKDKSEPKPHSASANSLLADYYIGDLNQNIAPDQAQTNTRNTDAPTPVRSEKEDENEEEEEDD